MKCLVIYLHNPNGTIMTSVAYLDLHIENSESFEAEIILSNFTSNLPLTIHDIEFFGEIRKHHYSKNPSATFTTEISPFLKYVTVRLSNTQTNALRPGRYIYDIFCHDKRELAHKYSTAFIPTSLIEKNITIPPTTFSIQFWFLPKEDGKIFSINGDTELTLILDESKVKIQEIEDCFIDVKLNEWVHIAITYENSNIKIFKNNSVVQTKTTTISFNECALIIGDGFKGNISNFKISNKIPSNFNLEYPLNTNTTDIILICNNSNIINNYTNINISDVTASDESPFKYKTYFFKLVEGNVMVYHTATKNFNLG